MKLLFSFVLLLFGVFAQAQTPDYFANNPSWHCGESSSDQWGPPPVIPWSKGYVFYVNGDTVANGNTYWRLFQRGWFSDGTNQGGINYTYDINAEVYLRQVGRTIHYFDNQLAQDKVLMDYMLGVGDTVEYNYGIGCWNQADTIQKVDSMLLNGEYRRVLYLDTLYGHVFTEGIGYQNQLNNTEGYAFFPYCDGPGFSYNIYCFGQNDISVWDATSQTSIDCHVNVGIEEETYLRCKVFPNPASDHIQINSESSFQFNKVQVWDLSGRLVKSKSFLQTKSASYDVSDVKAGLYWIVISSNEEKTVRKITIL